MKLTEINIGEHFFLFPKNIQNMWVCDCTNESLYIMLVEANSIEI